MSPVFIILFMLFCHIFDDYFLQGCLANLKQKSWWEKNAPDKLYKYDYQAGLACHSFSWTFMIMLPIAIATNWNMGWLFFAYPINMAIHWIVDDLKANRHKLNLIADQSLHLAQICLTFMFYCLFFVR